MSSDWNMERTSKYAVTIKIILKIHMHCHIEKIQLNYIVEIISIIEKNF